MSLIFTVVAFTFNTYLISRNFKKEFIANYKARESYLEFQKFLQNLPEGVSIIDDSTSQFKFINLKLKESLHIDSFIKTKQKIMKLEEMKREAEEGFKEILENIDKTNHEENSQKFMKDYLNNFSVLKKLPDNIEDHKNMLETFDTQMLDQESLYEFLENERKACQGQGKLSLETKISLYFQGIQPLEGVEILRKNFIVKTSRIQIDDIHNKNQIFLQMFIDTTQIKLLEEAKAQYNYQRTMLANVSHEFRTPLNAMNMSLELLKTAISPDYIKFHRIASSS